MNKVKAESEVLKILPFMVKHRRELHKIPELGYEEFKTSAYIQGVLKDLGFKFVTVGTGIIVNIKGINPTKTIGFRADMDALPFVEKHQSDYKSMHNGVMHACGHDGHMAMLLGFAKYLSLNPPTDNIVLVFQPAEEPVGESGLGAKQMTEHKSSRADIYYALHLDANIEVGAFEIWDYAGAEQFQITFTGTERHAAAHNGKQDAIQAAVKFIHELENLNDNKNFVFHIGTLNGGVTATTVSREIIANGTMRFFNKADREFAHKKIIEIISSIESNDIGKIKIQYDERICPPLINTISVANKVEKLDGFSKYNRTYGCEDFALFINEYTGTMLRLGAKTDGKYPIHNDRFTFDENALAMGLQIFTELLEI